MTSVVIPKNVQRIEVSSFNECQNLVTVTLPQTVSFDQCTFYMCDNLDASSISAIDAINRNARQCAE